MKELEYPFDAEQLMRKRKSLRKKLLEDPAAAWVDVKIAFLGGQTTRDLLQMTELFLLNQGIRPTFYESEFNRYYEDGMFPNPELEAFRPDIIYLCTCVRNIPVWPELRDGEAAVAEKREGVLERFRGLWTRLAETYHCAVIQNNFEYPYFRLMGNMDAVDPRGRVAFVNELNRALADWARTHERFYLCDINYLSAAYGLDRWSAPEYWHLYKYAVAVPAIPVLGFEVAKIVKSLYGKNKKAFNLDLDNTLWGGIVGDDGPENIEIGQETAMAQTYSEFQSYLKLHQQIGVLLTVNSKNEEENALSGLRRPDSVLKPEDFVSIKANWNPKNLNLTETARELSLLPESFVFTDDNPAERAMIAGQIPGAAVPEMEGPENYIRILDRSGFFEVTNLSGDDLKRTAMYQENAKRRQMEAAFENYEDYLRSLEMKAEIAPFASVYMARIAQLTNKSNQFNLTTRRFTQAEIEEAAADPGRICLYGKLEDRFGDNGVVSVVMGRTEGEAGEELHMELWLMSCRVLKRDMELAMMDELAERALKKGIRRIYGYYAPTAKNGMVRDFYGNLGFTRIREDEAGNTLWMLDLSGGYERKQRVIRVNGE